MNTKRTIAAAALFLLSLTSIHADPQPAKGKPLALDRAALEKQFSEKLTGALMIGSYSTDGKESPRKDKYEIISATRLPQGDDNWLIVSQYGEKENKVPIPVPLKVLWAGDTPVMSLTDLTIPGMGTFTARVMFYGDRYVGTWQHGSHGGHMWGKVEKKTAAETKPKP